MIYTFTDWQTYSEPASVGFDLDWAADDAMNGYPPLPPLEALRQAAVERALVTDTATSVYLRHWWLALLGDVVCRLHPVTAHPDALSADGYSPSETYWYGEFGWYIPPAEGFLVISPYASGGWIAWIGLPEDVTFNSEREVESINLSEYWTAPNAIGPWSPSIGTMDALTVTGPHTPLAPAYSGAAIVYPWRDHRLLEQQKRTMSAVETLIHNLIPQFVNHYDNGGTWDRHYQYEFHDQPSPIAPAWTEADILTYIGDEELYTLDDIGQTQLGKWGLQKYKILSQLRWVRYQDAIVEADERYVAAYIGNYTSDEDMQGLYDSWNATTWTEIEPADFLSTEGWSQWVGSYKWLGIAGYYHNDSGATELRRVRRKIGIELDYTIACTMDVYESISRPGTGGIAAGDEIHDEPSVNGVVYDPPSDIDAFGYLVESDISGTSDTIKSSWLGNIDTPPQKNILQNSFASHALRVRDDIAVVKFNVPGGFTFQ